MDILASTANIAHNDYAGCDTMMHHHGQCFHSDPNFSALCSPVGIRSVSKIIFRPFLGSESQANDLRYVKLSIKKKTTT